MRMLSDDDIRWLLMPALAKLTPDRLNKMKRNGEHRTWLAFELIKALRGTGNVIVLSVAPPVGSPPLEGAKEALQHVMRDNTERAAAERALIEAAVRLGTRDLRPLVESPPKVYHGDGAKEVEQP